MSRRVCLDTLIDVTKQHIDLSRRSRERPAEQRGPLPHRGVRSTTAGTIGPRLMD